MKSRKPVKRSRRCPRGIRKSDGRCKRKPGPKRSRKMKKSRRRTKPVKRSRRCPRGIRKSDGRCKRKPGPKRSRKIKKFRMMNIFKKIKMKRKKQPSKAPEIVVKDNKSISDFYYDKNDPNVDDLRKKAIRVFIDKGVEFASGTYSKIYINPKHPDWILRVSSVKKSEIVDEIKITKTMFNRPEQRSDLTDIWVEPSKDDKGKIYSIVRKFTTDGRKFLESEFAKNEEILQKFYELLILEFSYLNENGWNCFDLKPGNVLINIPGPSVEHWLNNDNWVRLTDFGADWCKNRKSINDAIPPAFQTLFMILLFQFNTVLHLDTSDMQELIRIRLLTLFQQELFGTSKKPKLLKSKLLKSKLLKSKLLKKKLVGSKQDTKHIIEGFQKIYNFFIYLLVVPWKLLKDKYKPVQPNYLHYTCTRNPPRGKRYNFDENIDICKTLNIIKSYFIPINVLSGNIINMQDEVINTYKDLVETTKLKPGKDKDGNDKDPYERYSELIGKESEGKESPLSKIKKQLGI